MRKILLVLFIFLISSIQVNAAITIGTSTAQDVSDTDPASFAHNNGSNDFLMAGMLQETSGAGSIGGNATYAAIAMSLIETEQAQSALVAMRMNYLVAPAADSNTLSWDLATVETDQTMWALSFDGVDQSSPIGETGVQAGTATDPSVTITTTVANSVLVMFVAHEDDEAISESGAEAWAQQVNVTGGSGDREQVYTLQTTSIGDYVFQMTKPSDDYIFIWAELITLVEEPGGEERRIW
jgi:hypothetical protein